MTRIAAMTLIGQHGKIGAVFGDHRQDEKRYLRDQKKGGAKKNTGQLGHPVLIDTAGSMLVPDLLGGDDAFVAGIRFAATTCVTGAANA